MNGLVSISALMRFPIGALRLISDMSSASLLKLDAGQSGYHAKRRLVGGGRISRTMRKRFTGRPVHRIGYLRRTSNVFLATLSSWDFSSTLALTSIALFQRVARNSERFLLQYRNTVRVMNKFRSF